MVKKSFISQDSLLHKKKIRAMDLFVIKWGRGLGSNIVDIKKELMELFFR